MALPCCVASTAAEPAAVCCLAPHAPGACACVQLLLQRCNLASVFLVIPTGFLRALASKHVSLDEDADSDADSDAGDLGAGHGDDAAAVVTAAPGGGAPQKVRQRARDGAVHGSAARCLFVLAPIRATNRARSSLSRTAHWPPARCSST